MTARVQVTDLEGQVLFECPVEEKDRAYSYAAQMEELGIEVLVKAPTLPESLAMSLGMSEEERKELHDTIIHEIEEHDIGCCFEKDETAEDAAPAE